MKLASLTREIDLIIGGHTHTVLPKPTVTKNLDGKNVLVNQVGWAGVNLGKIDFFLDSKGGKNSKGATILV
jgi:5'-nucleotidase